MKITKATPSKEPSIPLGEIKAGECFRFAHDTFEEALKCDSFFMRVDAPEFRDGVEIVNLSDGKKMKRDSDHRVIRHKCNLQIDA